MLLLVLCLLVFAATAKGTSLQVDGAQYSRVGEFAFSLAMDDLERQNNVKSFTYDHLDETRTRQLHVAEGLLNRIKCNSLFGNVDDDIQNLNALLNSSDLSLTDLMISSEDLNSWQRRGAIKQLQLRTEFLGYDQSKSKISLRKMSSYLDYWIAVQGISPVEIENNPEKMAKLMGLPV
jgi:predicted DNA binding CopG/RHH family protein